LSKSFQIVVQKVVRKLVIGKKLVEILKRVGEEEEEEEGDL
jgi:hypothetical protein